MNIVMTHTCACPEYTLAADTAYRNVPRAVAKKMLAPCVPAGKVLPGGGFELIPAAEEYDPEKHKKYRLHPFQFIRDAAPEEDIEDDDEEDNDED